MSPGSYSHPPRRVCVLRLSALGDVCHVLPVVRTLQDAWPTTEITWIIGKLEHKLLGHLPGIEFVVFDKRAGRAAYGDLRRRFADRRFDVLLHMQLALRASLAAALVPAEVKVGFDRARARELQWLFTNAKIAPREREHVLDSLFGFVECLGLRQRSMRWDIPLPDAALDYARRAIPDGQAARHGLRVLVCGGRSELEVQYGERIAALMRQPCMNLVGKDTLVEFLATLQRATALISPDSGPAHMATAVGTPVIGLYAATNPARSGPYYSRQWCVDRYEAAALKFKGKPAAELPWTEKIEQPGVMDLITPADVIERLDALLAAR